jgi:hypothetical protein
LPRAVRFPSGKLAFETGRGVLRAVGLHVGPKALLFQKFVHLLSTNMVMLDMYFFHP